MSNESMGAVTGMLVDKETNQPIPLANAALYQNDVLVTVAITHVDGTFTIPSAPSGFSELKATYIGFKPVHKLLNVEPNKTTSVGALQLTPES